MRFDFDTLLSYTPDPLRLRIEGLKDVPQRADYHPEGNVYNHTKIVVNRLIKYKDPTLSWAGMFHDIGKDETTKLNEKGVLQAIGHENVSADIVKLHEDWLFNMNADISHVWEIVKYHMRIKIFDDMKPSKRLTMAKLPTFGSLWLFKDADSMRTLTQAELDSVK